MGIRVVSEARDPAPGKEAEAAERERAAAALSESEARFRQVVESINEVFWLVDPIRNQILYISPAYERIWGRTCESLYATPGSWLEAIHPGDRLRIQQAAVARLAGETYAEEYRILRPDGSERWIHDKAFPVRGPDGDIERLVGVAEDITERKQMEVKLQNAAKMESVGILAGGIAHDFNNILTAILSNLTLLQMDLGSMPEQASVLDEAVRATKRAAELTHRLLTFARGGDPVRTAVQLPEVIREAAIFAHRGSSVKCRFDMAADLWAADADKAQVSQVIQNLVINATQAMPKGGVISIAAANEHVPAGARAAFPEGDYIRVTVADTGGGIPPEQIARIFEPYFTTKMQGHGLGLSTVFSIIKRHQGHIEVASTVGKGTAFTFWLPAAKATWGAPDPSVAFADDGNGGRILFMDDEEPILRMAEKLMARMGLEVETARDGRAAIELYRRAKEAGHPFNLVVMDLTIPDGMGGREVISVLRQFDPGVKAIVSSGYSSDLAMADFAKHGFRAMVAKPYDIAELAAAIRRVLAGA